MVRLGAYLILLVLHAALELQDLIPPLAGEAHQLLALGLQLRVHPVQLILQQLPLLLHTLLLVLYTYPHTNARVRDQL